MLNSRHLNLTVTFSKLPNALSICWTVTTSRTNNSKRRLEVKNQNLWQEIKHCLEHQRPLNMLTLQMRILNHQFVLIFLYVDTHSLLDLNLSSQWLSSILINLTLNPADHLNLCIRQLQLQTQVIPLLYLKYFKTLQIPLTHFPNLDLLLENHLPW